MRWGHSPVLMAFASLILSEPGISRAADISWPEAVGRLAGERTKAETCAAVLKGYGDKRQIFQGQMAYGEAKANFDGVIAELVTALTDLSSARIGRFMHSMRKAKSFGDARRQIPRGRSTSPATAG
jgi:hypothetical protein